MGERVNVVGAGEPDRWRQILVEGKVRKRKFLVSDRKWL